MVGISVASNKEWKFVLEYYKDKIDKVYNYIFGEYFYASINDKKVLIYKCGARKSNASASTQYMIDKFNLGKIILIGTAAGVNKSYKLLDILIPNTAIQGDCNFVEKGGSFKINSLLKLIFQSIIISNQQQFVHFINHLYIKKIAN